MPIEYVTREKLLSSFTLSIAFSFSCPPTSPSSSALSELCSLCFLFSVLPCTSVSFFSDSGHENCSSLESWPFIPANFSNARKWYYLIYYIISSSFLSTITIYKRLIKFNIKTSYLPTKLLFALLSRSPYVSPLVCRPLYNNHWSYLNIPFH